jgi:hypothetical protein
MTVSLIPNFDTRNTVRGIPTLASPKPPLIWPGLDNDGMIVSVFTQNKAAEKPHVRT